MVIEGRHATTSARDALPRACTLYTRALHQGLCYCVCSISSRTVSCVQSSNLSEQKSLNGDVVEQNTCFRHLEWRPNGWRAQIFRAGKSFKAPTRPTAEQARRDVEALLKKAAPCLYCQPACFVSIVHCQHALSALSL